MPAPQSASNHTALDPITHFILAPIFFITLGWTVSVTVRTWPNQAALHLGLVLLALGFILLNIKSLVYSLKLQDRIIRLEERQRLATLIPAADLAHTASLTTRQLIALRFAPDAELPALALRTAAENLAPKQIKQAIATWRPDHARI